MDTVARSLEWLESRSPEVVQLGTYLSLAARVEPSLLRVARLALLPGADASVEADYWFSDLIAIRTSDWLIPDQDFARELRRRLARDRASLRKAHALILTAHADAPPTLLLEEQIIWADTADDAGSAQVEIETLLERAVSQMVFETDDGPRLGRWFAAAALRMPHRATRTSAFALLSQLSSILLDGRCVANSHTDYVAAMEHLPSVLPAGLEKESIWIARTERGLHLNAVAAAGYHPIELPRSDPKLLLVRSGEFKELVVLRRGESRSVALPPGEAQVQTALGGIYRVLSRRSASASQQAARVRLHSDLTRWYPSQADARRIAAECGLDATLIDFSGSPSESWFRILQQADVSGRIDAFYAMARSRQANELELLDSPSFDVLSSDPPHARNPTAHRAALRVLLEQLYPNRSEAERFLADCGLDSARIDLSGAPREFWFRILSEADKAAAVDAVIALARHEYPEAFSKVGIGRGPVAATPTPATHDDHDDSSDNDSDGDDPEPSSQQRLKALLLTDLVNSTRLVEALGDERAAEVFRQHDRMARDLLTQFSGQEIDKTDGFLMIFDLPEQAVRYALAYHQALADLSKQLDVQLQARAGIHLGQVILRQNRMHDIVRGAKTLEVEGHAKPIAARLMSLALPGQTLLSVVAHELASHATRHDATLQWQSHGAYAFKGVSKPAEVFEVGFAKAKLLGPPEDTEKAWRAKLNGQTTGPEPAPTPEPATIALVGVQSDLGDTLEAVATRLRNAFATTLLEPLDAGDAASADVTRTKLSDADFTVVLLGAATGGTDVLQTAGARQPPPLILKLRAIDPDSIPPAEFPILQALRTQATASFTTSTEAAELALDATVAWLRSRTPADPGHSPILESWERTYLQVRLPGWERGRFGPFVSRAQDLGLEQNQLYVSLRATTDLIWEEDEHDKTSKSRKLVIATPDLPSPKQARLQGTTEHGGDRERYAVHLERALSQPALPHLVIEGEAGAGKTVLLRHTAMILATLHTGGTPPKHALDLDALTGKRPLPPIPILLEAREIAACVADASGIAGLERAVFDELREAIGATEAAPEPKAVRAGLEAGRYLLLIDSLDETPGESARLDVVRTLQGYATAGLRSRLVLTTRPSAYLGKVTFGPPLRTLKVAPLATAEVGAMLDRWCTAQGCNTGYRQQLHTVIEALDANLNENPLLLTCTMLVYAKREQLPDSTAVLYHELVDALCQKPGGTFRPSERRQTLERVCLALQQAGGTQLTVDAAAGALQSERVERYPTVDAAAVALDRLAEETGLLRFRNGRDSRHRPSLHIQAWHRSFQEYLAACRIASGADSVVTATRRLFEPSANGTPIVEDPAWEGVLRFLVGVYGQQQVERAHAYIEELHKSLAMSARKGRILGLVASGLTEYSEHFANHPLLDSIPAEIVPAFRADGANWPLADRLLALEALGRLGDPRLDEDPWVDIPAGSFEMGGDEQALFSAPRHRVRISAFQIARRPVTVADFARFVEDGYYDIDAWWSAGRDDDDGKEPYEWQRQLHHPNRPVTGVSWYAAMAYCRWATERAQDRWPHSRGKKIDLPTEAEWEYAARGKASDIYPWGHESAEPGVGDAARANYDFEGSPGHPTPIGAFPAGDRDRLVDLAGNVWEWCADAWREEDDESWRADDADPRHPRDKEGPRGSPRVVRGGSWSSPAGFLRAAFRGRFDLGLRFTYLGFRVVCRGFPEHD